MADITLAGIISVLGNQKQLSIVALSIGHPGHNRSGTGLCGFGQSHLRL